MAASSGSIPSPPASMSNDTPDATPPYRPPSFEEIQAQDMFNNCAVRTVLSGVMGGGMGILMGGLFGALEVPLHTETMTTKQQILYQARAMGSKSKSMAKAFAVMGAIFSGVECVVEKERLLRIV
ncbi:hypothetical protein Mapa_008724 [Marchantia paleacea]|nr:hypothetical protein Mapa_008724 [Marchantia paleacea]